LMARRDSSAPAYEQAETVVEALHELIEAQRAESHRRKLDRERDPVEATCQLERCGLVLYRQLETCAGLPCAFEQQGHSLRMGDLLRRHVSVTARHRQGAHLHAGLSANAEGLSAGGEDPYPRGLTKERVGED